MTIKLTYPVKSHQIEDLIPLYEEFKLVNPDIFGKWQELGKDFYNDDPAPYVPISKAVKEFLRERVEWESEAALIGAYADFGRLLYKETYLND